uniref:Dopamine receptor D3 n=1 Tax=Zonotrichia albicollis TaxID=44394 RepID=A0A8D2QKZ4_ZONAL
MSRKNTFLIGLEKNSYRKYKNHPSTHRGFYFPQSLQSCDFQSFLSLCSGSPMALFTRASSHPNATDPIPCGANSTTEPGLPHSHAYYALCYCILILAIIFGNVLVCLAVLRERTLQTTTNYLVVSLAVADLLVATLVMPWMVYLEEHMERQALPNRCQGTFSPCLSLKCAGQEMSTKRRLLAVFGLQRYRSFCHEASLPRAPGTAQPSRWEERRRSTKAAVQVRRLSNGGTISSLRLAQQQPRLIQLRERKATQMLAIVLGAFIVCWLPFFLIHILNAHCPSCHVPPGLYSASTWLGYVNSALNPIIYTTFNTDFRKAFLKILCC